MITYDTLSEAIKGKQDKGYWFNFNLKKDHISCPELKKHFMAEEFHVDCFYRFEGDTNPDDTSILYAISTTCGVKGLLVDAYGVYSEGLSTGIMDKLKMK
ncbi:phosphoribosylpyrophosphate synthetase [Muricauda oceani]|uniref:Phosphoribosylpyrophosphate synthetase n=1 Tax=Flagellimonas oceani TaxID=2698672 RepID=A0A6G7J066_9FLAO|nr:phosphoribosylpyrophosphate synthetase [Allomuricauda oceani]MBW8244801.1 phosphoribosylpyrophosphate synthetase [Allomuricauda oceani]QII43887.1 phosphoribosylpyrophosphate synthetase [Allomuricauda oceani]